MRCARRRIGNGWECFDFTQGLSGERFLNCRPDSGLDDFFFVGDLLKEKKGKERVLAGNHKQDNEFFITGIIASLAHNSKWTIVRV